MSEKNQQNLSEDSQELSPVLETEQDLEQQNHQETTDQLDDQRVEQTSPNEVQIESISEEELDEEIHQIQLLDETDEDFMEEESDDSDFSDGLFDFLMNQIRERDMEIQNVEVQPITNDNPSEPITNVPLTYSYLLSQNYSPPEEVVCEGELVVPLIIGHVHLYPQHSAPFILRGALCSTIRQILHTTNGVLRVCVVHRTSFEQNTDIYGCVGIVGSYEDNVDSISLVIEGIRQCRVQLREPRETVIPIVTVQVLPPPLDCERLRRYAQQLGSSGYLWWKTKSLNVLRNSIIEYIRKFYGTEAERIGNILDNNEFVTEALHYILLSEEENAEFEQSKTIQEEFEILQRCTIATELHCAHCRNRNNETPICSTRQIISINVGGVTTNHVNPGGFTFTITTTSTAVNVLSVTLPSAEFSWFEGYTWEIVECAICRNHIGWRFQAIEGEEITPRTFYGLRSDWK
ncbi:CULT domain-containing protein [Entamoeba marina]